MIENDPTESSSGSQRDAGTAVELGFPEDVFACPECGQLLGPACRVCVACRKPIDPAKIRRGVSPASGFQPRPERAADRVNYPWGLLLVFILGMALGGGFLLRFVGMDRFQRIAITAQLLASVWVLFDARQLRVPRPLRWAGGTLLFWGIFFPWYLSRRRRPRAICRFDEREYRPIVRILLFALTLFVLLISIDIVLSTAIKL